MNEYRTYAVKNHEVIGTIDVAPWSEEALDRLCKGEGFDGWIYLSPKSALALMQVKEAKEMSDDKQVKQLLIRGIINAGFPVGFVRSEADGCYGFFAKGQDEVYPFGYAAEELGKDALTLDKLNIIDLSSLLEYGKDKNSINEAKELFEIERTGEEQNE